MSKPYNVASTLASLIELYVDDPVAFVEDILEAEPDDWQKEVLMDIAGYPRVSVRSGQGVGKTALEAWVVIWFLMCRPNPKVICTAPTRAQLTDVLWAEIGKWLEKSKVKNILKWTKTKVYMIGREERWFATMRTATRAENMQGFHEDYMLFIVDEASGIADPIMEAILGTLSGEENKLLMCGNPTRTSGVFYDSHNKDREHYRIHKVSSLDSKRTNKQNIEMLIRKYGEDSDVVRVRVYGEFPRSEPNTYIALELVETATEYNIAPIGNKLYLGVDVARFGDDETVIAPRIGMKCFDLQVYRKKDTMETTGYVLATAREYMEKYPQLVEVVINVDDDGLGGGVTDRLKEVIYEQGLPYEVNPVKNGSSAENADDNEHYADLGTENWARVRNILHEHFSNVINGKEPIVQLPNDQKLISQLSTRKYRMDSKGRIKLESKDDMKKRGLDSPDRADAVVLSFYEKSSADENMLAALRGVRIYG
jgi:phage terminase large subunit